MNVIILRYIINPLTYKAKISKKNLVLQTKINTITNFFKHS